MLHLTVGTVHPNFVELDPYDNLVSGFRVIPVAIAYIVSVALLGLHHEQLTYQHAGRNFRLTDVSGNVVNEILS